MKLKNLSGYRRVWMGFAILWIIIYHTGMRLGFMPLRVFKNMGYGGADIFLFASGVGCYASLNRDDDLLRFMKRRFLRLAPVYFPFIVPWLIGRILLREASVMMVAGNLLGIRSFTDAADNFNWYISATLLMYVLAPYFKQLVDQLRPGKLLIALLITMLSSVAFWTVPHLMIIATRIPVFFVGMYIGRFCCEEDRVLTKKQMLVAILAMLAGTALLILFKVSVDGTGMWNYGLNWYPFIMITPGLCLCLSWAAMKMDGIRCLAWIPKAMGIVGKYSFELFLLHAFVFSLVRMGIDKWNLHPYSNRIWLAVLVLLPLMLICFRWYVRMVNRAAASLRRRWSR